MTRKPFPSELAERFIVRMPPGMRSELAEQARRNQRSANSQIVWMLQQMMEQIKAGERRSVA